MENDAQFEWVNSRVMTHKILEKQTNSAEFFQKRGQPALQFENSQYAWAK